MYVYVYKYKCISIHEDICESDVNDNHHDNDTILAILNGTRPHPPIYMTQYLYIYIYI